jgi:7-carboxy-7-deazaguanine synthase
MLINEIFYSIQGEGQHIGCPMTFIRVTGCNLRCSWCDTQYAYSEGKELEIQEILDQVSKYPTNQVCLTGGEPLTQEDAPKLIRHLIELNYIVHLETNGSINIGDLPRSESIRISMDIKCPSSGEEDKMIFSNLELLKHGDQVKFIIADEDDYEYAKQILKKELPDPECGIIFTPCHQPKSPTNNERERSALSLKSLADMVLKDGLKVRVLPQLHKIIWPRINRGV